MQPWCTLASRGQRALQPGTTWAHCTTDWPAAQELRLLHARMLLDCHACEPTKRKSFFLMLFCSGPNPMKRWSVLAAAAMLAFSISLVGCQDSSYSSYIRYHLRTDPLVVGDKLG